MQAVILAAGMGRRLAEYTQNNTKCMVEVNGKRLIEHTLERIYPLGLSRLIMVVGYEGEKVEAFLGDRWKDLPITYIYNRDYDTTNNIYSLYLAREEFAREDTLLLESDLLFSSQAIEELSKYPHPNVVLVAKHKPWMDGTVVEIDREDTITRFISKEEFVFHEAENYYKTINIYKFSRDFIRKSYIPFLEAYVTSEGCNQYYEEVLRVINFFNKKNLKACVLDKQTLWYEIDDKQDLDNATLLFAEENQLELVQRRYGGYWRFSSFLDFCYLVNPYFPPAQMLEEMKHSFDYLVADYPSGLDVQNLLMAKMFGLPEGMVLTGNGAAELINHLLERLVQENPDVRVGFILPTFNEYPQRVPAGNARYLQTGSDFSYGTEELREFSREIDVLVLINPDNPSGNFIPAAQLEPLLEELSAAGKRVILDESFVDFAQDGLEQSLLHRHFLEKNRGVTVIKSISKSYGIPGLRLGLMASGNSALLQAVRKRLSIWNINSLGEFFLQIYGKYEKNYQEACRRIIAERDRFYGELQALPGLTVYPSQANYFLCRLGKGVSLSSTELTRRLLKENQIFIKDLAGKPGMGEEQDCLRLAVRDRADNGKLLQRLRELLE